MSDDLTFGVAIASTGDDSMVSAAKDARTALDDLKQSTDELAAASAKMAASSGDDYASLQKKLNDFAIAEENAQAKAWALASGYKDVGGIMVKASADATEGMHEFSLANAGTTRELMVLGHEAMNGNVSRIPGSLMVLANRSGLVSSGMLGMAAAIAVPVAAIGTLIVAAIEGDKELEAMNRDLAMTGDYSGQTSNSLYALAHSLSDTTQLTIGQSKDLATQLAASGKIGADAFGSVATAVAMYAAATGESEAKVTPMMLKIFSDPAKGAAELNSTMHFLNSAQLDHIATLEREGQLSQAQLALADALTEKFKGQDENIGWLQSAWNGLGKAASSAWDSMERVGRPQTFDEQIATIKQQMGQVQHDMESAFNTEPYIVSLQKLQTQLNTLQASKAKDSADANAKGQAAETQIYDSQTLAIARQNSELYKKYQLQEQLARVTGGGTVQAPSDDAVMQDAAAGLSNKIDKDGSAKILADAQRLDTQMVDSHEDAFSKTIEQWTAMQVAMTDAGIYYGKVREDHEAAYTAFVADETVKRNTEAEAAAQKKAAAEAAHMATQMANENLYFAQVAAATGKSDKSAQAAEDKRFKDEAAAWQKRYEQAQNDHALSLAEEEAFQNAIFSLTASHNAAMTQLNAQQALADLQTLGSKSKAFFEISQLAAISDIVMSGGKRAEASAAWAATWGGPVAAGIAEGLSWAATAINVAKVANTPFGGASVSSSGGAASFNAPVGTPATPVTVQQAPPGQAVAAQATQQYNYTIIGAKQNLDAASISFNTAVAMLTALNKAGQNGYKFNATLIPG